MARMETDTPRSAKRRKLVQTTEPMSAPATKTSAKQHELDLYDDIDGALSKSEPKKKRGWKGWVEIDEDEDEDQDQEVAVEEEVTAVTRSRRQAKMKAKETLGSLAWTNSGRTNSKPRITAGADNGDGEEDVHAIAYRGPGRPTMRRKNQRKDTSPEDSIEDLPDAGSPTKTPLRRRRGAVEKRSTPLDIEMKDVQTATNSAGELRSITEDRTAAETPSKSRRRPRKIVENEDEEEDEELVVTRTPSKGQKQRRQRRQLDDTLDEPEAMDLDMTEKYVETTTSPKAVTKHGIPMDKAAASDEIALVKSIVLSKLTHRRPVPLTNLDTEYAKVHQLLEATVTSGESNSMLLIGARGSGKTALINKTLLELSRSQKEHFYIVRLNGFIQTDDKLALREIWRQLGREMEIEDEEGTTSKSYADTLAMLLALLSHPDEISGERGGQTAKSVLFIMDEFDLFATHPRQTLLYNLLDIAQSRKAPIAVLGLTTRIDVTEALEKRVKSRFSHRYVHLNLARTMGEFVDAAKAALKISPEELDFEEKVVLVNSNMTGGKTKAQNGGVLERWSHAIDSIFSNTTFQRTILHPPYHTSKSLPALFSSLLLPISALGALPTPSSFFSLSTLLMPPSSNLHLLASLSNLSLSLLIAAARLSIIHNTTTTNFPLAYAEYVNLASKARINANAAGQLATGSGMRVYGKEVARREWEGLVKLGLCVKVGGGAFGAGHAIGGGGGREMVRVDVALEEIPSQVELGMVMEKWCKQI